MTDNKVRKVSALPNRPTMHPDFDPGDMSGVRRLAPFVEDGPMVEVCVANGRSVHAPAADGSKRIVGFDTTKNENVYAIVQESYGPGQRLSLRGSEADRLKGLGFVVAPEDYKEPPPREEQEVTRVGPREMS